MTMTDDEWENLIENFETADLLSAVDSVDSLRAELNDGESLEPPELRTDMLRLHDLAMAVINEGDRDQASEMFNLAVDLEDQVSDMKTKLEQIEDTLAKLVALYPESLSDGR